MNNSPIGFENGSDARLIFADEPKAAGLSKTKANQVALAARFRAAAPLGAPKPFGRHGLQRVARGGTEKSLQGSFVASMPAPSHITVRTNQNEACLINMFGPGVWEMENVDGTRSLADSSV